MTQHDIFKFLQTLAVVFALILSACGGGSGSSSSGDDVSQACNESTDGISFGGQVLPIFNDYCVVCHQPGTVLSTHPYLTVELAYDALVTNPVLTTAAPLLVTSGEPENSRLYIRISVVSGPGDPMPPGGSDFSDGKVCIIEKWIEQGALNN